MPTKTCLTCGQKFVVTSKHPNAKYCSLQCSAKARSKRKTLECPGCGVVFTQANPVQKYCSADCGFKHRPRPARDESKRCTKTCIVCGTEFQSWVYRNASCCSRKCASTLSKGVPKPTKQRPDSYVTVFCEVCGKEYVVHGIFITQRNSRFCSRACMGKWKAEQMTGAGNPMYIGGTRFPDRGANWGAQRKAALRRDGRKCRLCGRKPRKGQKWVVDVHHIKPYRLFDGDYLAANDLLNLITLCRYCHAQVEDRGMPCPQPLL